MPIYAKSSVNGEDKERLAEHTIHDIRAGQVLVQNLPFAERKKKQISKDLELALALHDVGKSASGFQAQLEKDAPYWGHRHEVLSAAFASMLKVKEEIILAVLTHHKTIPSDFTTAHGCLKEEEIPYRPAGHIYEVWNQMAAEWNENIPQFLEEWCKICRYIKREDLLSQQLGALPPLQDNMGVNWLNRLNQPDTISFKQRHYASLLRGLLISADHITSADSNNMPMKIPVLNSYDVTSHNLYGYQIRAGKKVGNLILRSPTGSGKTEAALLWAQRNQKKNGRLFYTLPSTASLNAMYLRLKKSFNDVDNKLIGLLHSRIASSIYSMFENGHDSQSLVWMLSSLAKEMYFPIRVCTPHQVLKFTLFGKGWEMMLSEFPNSVFIFDEIHAYNPKHVGLTMATAKYIIKKGGSVMFLSATLPKFLRRIIQREIPDITFMQPSMKNTSDRHILEQKRHIIEPIDGNILDNIDLIVSESNKVKSTLIVCNHVPTAQRVYKELVKQVKDTVLLHSQFCRRDRNKVENELQRSKGLNGSYKPLPKILVSTQVVEVSLDLDFEQGFSEPAPLDAIVQRMGRVNRYAKRDAAMFRIFTKQLNKDNKVYTEELRNRSLQVLCSLPNPVGEEDLNFAADKVYGKGYDSDMKEEYNEGLNCIDIKSMIAGTNRDWVEDIINDSEGAIEILPEGLVDEYNMKKRQGLAIEAYNLAVPVGKWRLGYLMDRIDRTQDIWVLNDCNYSSEVGLEIGERDSYVAI